MHKFVKTIPKLGSSHSLISTAFVGLDQIRQTDSSADQLSHVRVHEQLAIHLAFLVQWHPLGTVHLQIYGQLFIDSVYHVFTGEPFVVVRNGQIEAVAIDAVGVAVRPNLDQFVRRYVLAGVEAV